MERPPLFFDVGDRRIKWTYGLSQDLQRLCPDPSNVIEILAVDANSRDYFVRRALTDINKIVSNPEEELIPIDQVNLEPEEVGDLLNWIASHLLFFMLQSATKLKSLGDQVKTILPEPSSDGSES